MVKWPRPTSVTALRGFLELTGYYRKYVANYGSICRPLTELLKKNAFGWNEEIEKAFVALKDDMTNTLVLALPDYSQEFVIKADASHSGLGVVLMKNGRPIAYFSKVLAQRHMDKSIYEKEYMALLNVVDKWRHYLQYKYFVIIIDYHSLKYLLEKKVTYVIRQKGLAKLLGLDYEVQYKNGAKNRVADPLSRQYESFSLTPNLLHSAHLQAISMAVPIWIQEERERFMSEKQED